MAVSNLLQVVWRMRHLALMDQNDCLSRGHKLQVEAHMVLGSWLRWPVPNKLAPTFHLDLSKHMEHLLCARQPAKHCGYSTDCGWQPCAQKPAFHRERQPSQSTHPPGLTTLQPNPFLFLKCNRIIFTWGPLYPQCPWIITGLSQLNGHLLEGLLPCPPYLKHQHFLPI